MPAATASKGTQALPTQGKSMASTRASKAAGGLHIWWVHRLHKGVRERSGRCALSLGGIREVEPHLSPHRGNGDKAIEPRNLAAFNNLLDAPDTKMRLSTS